MPHPKHPRPDLDGRTGLLLLDPKWAVPGVPPEDHTPEAFARELAARDHLAGRPVDRQVMEGDFFELPDLTWSAREFVARHAAYSSMAELTDGELAAVRAYLNDLYLDLDDGRLAESFPGWVHVVVAARVPPSRAYCAFPSHPAVYVFPHPHPEAG